MEESKNIYLKLKFTKTFSLSLGTSADVIKEQFTVNKVEKKN